MLHIVALNRSNMLSIQNNLWLIQTKWWLGAQLCLFQQKACKLWKKQYIDFMKETTVLSSCLALLAKYKLSHVTSVCCQRGSFTVTVETQISNLIVWHCGSKLFRLQIRSSLSSYKSLTCHNRSFNAPTVQKIFSGLKINKSVHKPCVTKKKTTTIYLYFWNSLI